jgi:hypothetical protein
VLQLVQVLARAAHTSVVGAGRMMPILEIEGLRKVHGAGNLDAVALDGVDLSVDPGALLARAVPARAPCSCASV